MYKMLSDKIPVMLVSAFFTNLMLYQTANVLELLVTLVTRVREIWNSILDSNPTVLKLRLARWGVPCLL